MPRRPEARVPGVHHGAAPSPAAKVSSQNPKAPARRVDVSVMGITLSVRTDREDAWVHGLAGHVNRRLDELRRGAKNANPQQLAALLALNLAEELLTEQQRAAPDGRRSAGDGALQQELRSLTAGALARVQAALAALDDVDDVDDGVDDGDEDDDADEAEVDIVGAEA